MAAKWGDVAKGMHTHVFERFVAMPNGQSDVVQMLFLRHMCPGFEAHGLKDATVKLREGLRDLDIPGDPHTCLRCQAKKTNASLQLWQMLVSFMKRLLPHALLKPGSLPSLRLLLLVGRASLLLAPGSSLAS